jgi:arylsulfatase
MKKRKNVLLITGDHTRSDAVSCNADPENKFSLANIVKTPNLDSLANSGVTFTNGFTSNPICVPGRASITTGRYSHKCTTTKYNGGRIHDDEVKIAEYFAENGYATCAIGKLHYTPYSSPGEPRLLHGFQHAELCEEGRVIAKFDKEGKTKGLEDYHDYLYSVGWGGYERAHCTGNNDVHPAASVVPAEYHEEAWVADRTIAYLEEHLKNNEDKPFMMWSSFIKPHPPYDPPAPYDRMFDPREMPDSLGDDELLKGADDELYIRDKYYGWDLVSDEAVKNIRAHYCGMMVFQDAMIGRIVDYLKEKGLYEDTIILYTADHGDMLGDFGRFFKKSMYDGSVKVPFIVHAPGIVETNHVRLQMVGSQDVLPTLCSLADLEVPKGLDGIDLTPALIDPEAKIRDYYVSQTCGQPMQKYMVCGERWKYVYCQVNGTESLYDKNSGSDYELRNLAKDENYKDILADMRQVLIDWCKTNNDLAMFDENGLLKISSIDDLAKPELSKCGWRKY